MMQSTRLRLRPRPLLLIHRPARVLAVAASLALSTSGGFTGVPSAHAGGTLTSSGHSTTAPVVPRRTLLTPATLYDQTSGASTIATDSQNFEPANAAFTDFTADDFVVPANSTWTLSEIDVLGQYFNGVGPATSVNVFLYNDNAGLPGTQIAAYTNIAPTGGTTSPNFNIPIPAISLTAGTYWVSVQANESSVPNGEWGWTDRSPTANNGAAFSNPGNGFGTACHPGYGRRTTCVVGDLAAPDQAFKLLGQAAAPPSITKAFGASTIPLHGSTSLTFTITNPNASVALTGVGFIDTLPTGLVVATPSALTSTCGGTSTASAGSGSISVAGGSVAANASCTISINVTATGAGTLVNTTSTVSSTNAGTGNVATASITVVAPPTISKSFGAAAIAPGDTTSLSFTLTNPNATVSLTGVGFTDTLPAGLTVATPNGITGSCGGGTITAVAGSSTITLSGATLAPLASCTLAVNITATDVTGLQTNSVTATSANGGSSAAATTTITVGDPALFSKAFSAPAAAPNAPVRLTFKITNIDDYALTGLHFLDVLPGGMTVSLRPRLTGSCGAGTITAIPTAGYIKLTGGTVPALGSCTFYVYVVGTGFGWRTNVTSPITAANAPPGNHAVATILI